jgi:hypothetical protein
LIERTVIKEVLDYQARKRQTEREREREREREKEEDEDGEINDCRN